MTKRSVRLCLLIAPSIVVAIWVGVAVLSFFIEIQDSKLLMEITGIFIGLAMLIFMFGVFMPATVTFANKLYRGRSVEQDFRYAGFRLLRRIFLIRDADS